MKKRKYIVRLFAAILFLSGCNESLEDTYGDYAGDGKIRYVAKCSDVTTTPGWERLVVDWKNGTDATVNKIKVVWTFEERKDSVLLPKTSTSYNLTGLTDGTYRFDVCAVDTLGNESLREISYGRPYTREHEVMRAFTRGVLKPFFLSDKMIFFSDRWNENILEMKLKYKTPQGETKYYIFDKETSYNTLVTIDSVSMNPQDTVYVLRRGTLEGSLDEAPFEPYAVSRKKNFSAGFANAIERRYGYSTKTKEQEEEFLAFIEKAEELEFDYDVETLEDVLYCQNLKRLVVGKNRYLHGKKLTQYDNSKILSDPQKSYTVLDKAADPEVLGLKVHYYGNQSRYIHYFENTVKPYMVYEGYPELEQLTVVTTDELKKYEDGNYVRCNLADPYAVLNQLVDDNPDTPWATTNQNNMRTYEMQMQLKEKTAIRGIKVVQTSSTDWAAAFFMPATIAIQTSADGAVWENVTWFESNPLGRGVGEVTLLPMTGGTREVKYIKFTLRDGTDQMNNWKIHLGDIVLYK